MKRTTILIAAVLISSIGAHAQQTAVMDRSTDEVKRELHRLGYFFKKDSKAEMETFEKYSGDGRIQFPYENFSRVFFIDAEFIYEVDGIKDQIQEMIPKFKEMGINISITAYDEEFDNNSNTYTTRSIQLGGSLYDVSYVHDWQSAFESGVRLINQILIDNNRQERVYALSLDESSELIMLTPDQFNYLDRLIPKDGSIPPFKMNSEQTRRR